MILYKKSEVDPILRREIGNNNLLELITKIEIPTDDEIEDASIMMIEHPTQRDVATDYFIAGAKWMRDKIQGGNNEQ
jgi:hypothetical protein